MRIQATWEDRLAQLDLDGLLQEFVEHLELNPIGFPAVEAMAAKPQAPNRTVGAAVGRRLCFPGSRGRRNDLGQRAIAHRSQDPSSLCTLPSLPLLLQEKSV